MNTQSENIVKVLEDTPVVSPPQGSVSTTSLPLTFFDIRFLSYSSFQRLFFYEFPHPTLYFMQTTLPSLKTSLSLTLQHFFPFASDLVIPPPPQLPYLLYTEGGSVSFVVKESKSDFNRLIGDDARHVQEFQALVPILPPATATASMSPSNATIMQKPLMAIQVTVFPNRGISIGVAFSHVVADGMSFAHFMKSWAHVHRSQGDLTCINNSLPNFNREFIEDPEGIASLFLKESLKFEDLPRSTPIHKFQVTTNIKRSQVEFLKDWVKKKLMEENESEPIRVSTFVVTCAYMWVCLIKLQQKGTRNHLSTSDGNELFHFFFAADCRHRLKVPAAYFGNCTVLCIAAAKKRELLGENGVVVAAKAIGREILELGKAPVKEQETSSRTKEIFKAGHPIVFVWASPRLGVYKVDFGWGKPTKTEVANMGLSEFYSLFSIAESRDEDGGVEISLPLALDDLNSFGSVFKAGLLKL